MTDPETFAEVAEMIGRRLIRSEERRWKTEFVEDNVHIPLLRRIVEGVVAAARERGLPPEEAEAMRARLRDLAEAGYMETWMSQLYEDEDPDEERKAGERIFRMVWNGGRR